MRQRFNSVHAALVATSFFASSAVCAQAQTTSQLPTSEEINPPAPDRADRAGNVSVDGSAAFQRGPCPLAESDVTTTITQVAFTGPAGAQLSPELLRLVAPVAAPPAGDQPIRVVCDIRDRANQALRAARYVATVQIPPQRIDDGVLNLEVVSAKIVEMRVRGDAGPYRGLLENRIATLKALDPFNEGEAERLLLLADDVPGLDVQLALQPSGGAPGEVIGELSVNYQRFRLLVNLQNYNSRNLGRETGYLRGEYYGLTGLADLTYAAVSSTLDFDEQQIYQLGHEMLLDGSGLGVAVRGTYAISRPDLAALDLRTKSYIAGAELSYPLIRTLRTNLYGTLGFEHIDQRTQVFGPTGAAPLNLDRISAAYLRLAVDHGAVGPGAFETRSLRASVEVRRGLDTFNATRPGQLRNGFLPSRFEGDSVATIVRAQIEGVIGLTPWFDLAGQVRAQWANQPLLNYDEFSLGNLTVGRGYDPGSNTGDRAVATVIEGRVKLPLESSFDTQLFGFYDFVKLRNLDTTSTERNRRLESVGGGVRITLPGAMRLDLTYAHPLDPPLLTGPFNQRPPDRLLLSLTAQLVPLAYRR